MKLITGTQSYPLAEKIALYLDIPLLHILRHDFPDSECAITLPCSFLGEDVVYIPSVFRESSEETQEMLFTLKTLSQQHPNNLVLVLPYFRYGRNLSTAHLMAHLIESTGATEVMTIDLHTTEIETGFKIPVHHLNTLPLLGHVFGPHKGTNTLVLSPDRGGIARAQNAAKTLGLEFEVVTKTRKGPGHSEVVSLPEHVSGKHCILVDDIVDSAGTLCSTTDALLNEGALSVMGMVTHGVLSGDSLNRIHQSSLTELILTDSLPNNINPELFPKIRQVSLAPLLGETIRRLHLDQSKPLRRQGHSN